MKLVTIEIENYRSVEKAVFTVREIEGSFTFTLIGINESGKSNLLRGVFLTAPNQSVRYPEDYFDPNNEIKIALTYEIDDEDLLKIKSRLAKKEIHEQILSEIQISRVRLETSFPPEVNPPQNYKEIIDFYQSRYSIYTTFEGVPSFKLDTSNSEEIDLDWNEYFSKHQPALFSDYSHYSILWKADDRHLITNSINLANFFASPEAISVPLKNCFDLAQILDIPTVISKLKGNPSEVHNLQERLSDAVTNHIRTIWPEHKIRIKFQISDSYINFLIEDNDVLYATKTVDQRSEGFRQFISFLLTISAENASSTLNRTILLLDEPETHLHPKAQEALMLELIKLTSSINGNIVIYATHSNYLIDKSNLGRCRRVTKVGTTTTLEEIEDRFTSYSEVNYEIFQIESNDYHNELYGFIEAEAPEKLNALVKNKDWFNARTQKTLKVSLSTYIRHSIHHPENDVNPTVLPDELTESIEQLRVIKNQLKARANS